MDSFSLHYSDDNKKNTFNDGHGLKYIMCVQILRFYLHLTLHNAQTLLQALEDSSQPF